MITFSCNPLAMWYFSRMPTPATGEKLSHFIGRFVSSKRERKQFPDLKQRLAVGYSEAREKSRKAKNVKTA